MKATDRRRQRQEEAKLRQEAYNKLSLKEKLVKLDAGGFKAAKQREKLSLAKEYPRLDVAAEVMAEVLNVKRDGGLIVVTVKGKKK